MGWHGVANATPEQHDVDFLPPLETFLQYFIVAFSLQQRRGSPETLVELNLDLFDVPVSSTFSCTRIIHSIVIT